jgi:hypothetical protein
MHTDRYFTATAVAAGLLLVAAAVAAWVGVHSPRPVALTPTLTSQPEYCLTCHGDLPEISPSHPVKTFGCVICHGGERLALDADLAHSTMRGGRNPSDLSVVEASCGGSSCHDGAAKDGKDHIHRVETGLQATYAGAIASIRYTFGAQKDPTAHFGIEAVTDGDVTTPTGLPALERFDPAGETNPSIRKFAVNCLDCHLRAAPREGRYYERFTGCAACHSPLTLSPSPDIGRGKGVRAIHRLTTAIPYSQCNTCHNRGNYDLRTMTFVERTDLNGIPSPTRLQDYYQPIAQFVSCEWTLDCIDCHTRTEVMGDGDIHSGKKEIQYVQCRTCHGTLTELPRTRTITSEDDLALSLAFLNPVIDLKVGDAMLVTDKGEPLWNTRALPDGTYELFGKASGEHFIIRPVMGTNCLQKPDEQASQYCHACHSVQR